MIFYSSGLLNLAFDFGFRLLLLIIIGSIVELVIFTIYFDLNRAPFLSTLHREFGNSSIDFSIDYYLNNHINSTHCIKWMDLGFFFSLFFFLLIRSACLMFNEIKSGNISWFMPKFICFMHSWCSTEKKRKPISHAKTKAINFDHFSKRK